MTSLSRQRKALRMFVFPVAALTLALAAMAIPAFASATTQNWYECKHVGGGGYTNSQCTTAGKGTYEWSKLTSPTEIKTSAASPFHINWTLGGEKLSVGCSGATLAKEGKAENHTGANGTISRTYLEFSGCALTTSLQCELTTSKLFTEPLALEATEVAGEPGLAITPRTPNGPLTYLEVAGGNCPPGQKGFKTVNLPEGGRLFGNYRSGSLLEFQSSKNALTVGPPTVNATMEGTEKIETAAGGGLKIAP